MTIILTVFYLLDKLKSTATEPDGLPSWFLRLSAPIFAAPLADLINKSIRHSKVPTQWKSSLIKPIPKVASPSSPSDYRPISITSVLSRFTERIITTRYIYPAILSPPPELDFTNQFAFRPTGSTTAALISLYQTITTMLETESYVRVIALDFSKAFDTIRHSQLIDKISELSMPTEINGWIANFLKDRNHTTTFENHTSCSCTINASIVQGSAIGPPAFIITASDLIAKNPDNALNKFADDTYLVIPASNVLTTEDELTIVDNWAAQNNLKLNRSKSKELIFVAPKTKTIISYPPTIQGIERVTELKCLGVTLTANFSFSSHISNIINACSSNLFALYCLRSKGLSNELIHIIFQAATLSRLLYASPFWWGFLAAQDKERLEGFLRRARKAGFYSNGSTFEELCASADQKLFNTILCNSNHLLTPLLPSFNNHVHSTRRNTSNRTFHLSTKRSSLQDKNFITRMILDDARKPI